MKTLVVIWGTAAALSGASVAQACSVSADVFSKAPPGMVFSTLHCKYVPVGKKQLIPTIYIGQDYVWDWIKPNQPVQPVNPYDAFTSSPPTVLERLQAKQNQVTTWPKGHPKLDVLKDFGKQANNGNLAWAQQAQPLTAFKGVKSAG